MKTKFAFLLFFVTLTFTSFAQNDYGHLLFKGVPINGTSESFIKKLEQKGLKLKYFTEGTPIMTGSFANLENCTFMIFSTPQDKLGIVHSVGVISESYYSWENLYGFYKIIKDLLTIKYGSPFECTEKFQSHTLPKDDNAKLHEVIMDRCKYISKFSAPNGIIHIQISHNKECYISILYVDKINASYSLNNSIDDL